MNICDNIKCCHEPCVIKEDDNAMRIICNTCKKQFVIRKDPFKGTPENKAYSKIFKKDVLQGSDNLLYKYHPEFIKR